MKTHVYSALLLLGLAAVSCQSDDDDVTPQSLVGYWKLTQLECYCPAGTPTPNEAIEFKEDGKVTTYKNGQVEQTGTYTLGRGSTPCATDTAVVTLTWPDSYVKPSYSLQDKTLVLDGGICVDVSRKTYTFVSGSKKD